MRFSVLCLIALPLIAVAADSGADKSAAAQAAVRQLAAINGQALACGGVDVAARAKTLMLKHSPRTSAYGDIFQEATNSAFTDQTRRPPEECPDSATLGRQLDALAVRLEELLPSGDGAGK